MKTEPTKVLARMARERPIDEASPAEVAVPVVPTPEAGAEEPVRRRRGRSWLPWTLFAVAAAAAVFFFLRWQGAQDAETRRDEVATVANDFLIALTNFEAATIERDAEELRAFAVGQFADEVEQYFGPEEIADIKEAEARSTGEVLSVFVQGLEGESATVFGTVRQTVTNNTSEERVEMVRIEVGMIETSSGWKVNRVDILQTPVAPEAAA